MSAEVIAAKRPVDGTLVEPGANMKRLKSSTFDGDNTAFVGCSSVKVMRLLCPAHKIGGIIGKGGSIIFQISQETGAKVSVEENVPGCDERVIVIVGSDKDKGISSDQSKAETKDIECTELTENTDKIGNTDGEQAVSIDSQFEKEKEISSIQNALLVLFDKIVDGLSDVKEGEEGNNAPPLSVVRLLVFSGQVGCLLGKAGSVIKQMASDSGAQIRILPKDKLPSCASSSDELVQISGRIDAIRKAIHLVSQQLLDNYHRNQVLFPTTVTGPSSNFFVPLPKDDRVPSFNRPFHGPGAPHSSGFHDVEASNPTSVGFHPEVLSFRLVCSEEKVGGVIGKGGTVVKALQRETGCEVNVLDGGVDSEDRIIIISGPAFPDDRISPPQDAVLRVQSRIFRAAPENKEKTLTAKLLVSSHQIGCLLGKGGSVIAEMRKSTRANIRILGKDQVPKNTSEDEEVVQVIGELEVVLEALLQITTKLRNHFFRDVLPRNWEQVPPFPLHMNREFSSGMFANRGPPFNNYDGPRGPPLGAGFHAHDDRPPFAHDDRHPFGHGFPGPGYHHISERMPAASMWGPEGPIEGPGPIGFHDHPGPPTGRLGGFTGNQQAIITSTKVEVVVPRFVVPAIHGEDGGCLRQIREISDAKITIMDPKPGATETTIIISGTPEQANAAQSLIQAFVISETTPR